MVQAGGNLVYQMADEFSGFDEAAIPCLQQKSEDALYDSCQRWSSDVARLQ